MPTDLAVRAPRQERSRRRWAGVLDAGVELIEAGGVDALTIAAVCARAGVPPRFIYERVTSKDALFLAVYEHGMARVRAGEVAFDDEARWAGLTQAEAVRAAVLELAGLFERNHAFLRPIVLVSSTHPEVRARGAASVDALRRRFAARVTGAADVEPAGSVFRTLFAALAFRTAYGDDFLSPRMSDAEFAAELVHVALRTLDAPGR